jgi:gliding motility-associated lipoprotein GldH
MKNTYFIPGLLFILILSSCNQVYRDFEEVKEMKWYKSDVKTFEFDIKNEGNYDLIFCMRHSTGYQFMTIKTKISMTTPDYEVYEKEAEFLVTNEKGEYIGDGTGQLWDIEEAFSANELLKKGHYKISIAHAMENDPVILVMEIGLKVKKSK